MAFNIAEFAANLGNRGIAKSSNFTMQITRTPAPDSGIERDIVFRINATDLPGVTVTTIEHSYIGPTHKIATGSQYTDHNISVILSEDLSEKKYFEQWKRMAVGDYSNGAIGADMFRLSYYKDYIGSALITTYSETGYPTYQVRLHEVYPIMINSVSLSWANGNEIMSLPITLAYRYYTEERIS